MIELIRIFCKGRIVSLLVHGGRLGVVMVGLHIRRRCGQEGKIVHMPIDWNQTMRAGPELYAKMDIPWAEGVVEARGYAARRE